MTELVFLGMDKQEYLKQLQAELAELNEKHKKLEVTVKNWNEQRREIGQKIDAAELEMLDLRVQAWRRYRDGQKQLELF